ncbi:LysR family transcriptional regulator [Brackiella oedipodis]|uniref:LysR family transcriptional regulator n=1 Tax=Brackiella oedipodis TaxID=124225 RepID=UPI00048DA4E0|nr:LysR family transcriptional regulator [Brackiella oedipodis]
MLEIRHLQSLLVLHQENSLQDAADRLAITQSALSHQIKELEGRLGVQLLNRKRRPARLTTAALRIVQLAENVLPQITLTERELRKLAHGQSGRLNIAIDCHSCFDWLMPTLDEYRQQWNEVSLDLTAAFSFNPLPALARGDLDLVFTSDPQNINGLQYVPLFKYELVLAVAHSSPLAQKRFVQPQDLEDQVLITYPVDRNRMDIFTKFLDPADVEPAMVRQTELTPMIIQLVNSNRGVSALPSWALHKEAQQNWIHTCHLGEAPGIWITLYAAFREEDSQSEYLQDFIHMANTTCFKNLSGIRKVDL